MVVRHVMDIFKCFSFNMKHMHTKIRFFWIVFLLFFVLPSSAYAYDIKCEIQIIPNNFSELVTTDSFYLNTTIINMGNSTYPSTPVNVTIYNPDSKILEDYYSYIFLLPNLPSNTSFSYKKPFDYKNETYYSLYEMPMAGTWKVNIALLSPPSDDITYTHTGNVVRKNGECWKYFYVKDMGQYQKERQDEILQKEKEKHDETLQNESEKLQIEIQQRNETLQSRIESLTIAMWFLAFISAITIIREIGTKIKNFLVGFVGIILSLYAIFYQNSLSLTIIGIVGIAISFSITVESEIIRRYRFLYNSFLIIIFIAVLSFYIEFVLKNITDYLMLTIVSLGLLAFSFAVVELFKEEE